MDNQTPKPKRSGQRPSILILEGIIVVVAFVIAYRFIVGGDEENTVEMVQATVAAVEAELQATIDAQAVLLNATPAMDADAIRSRAEEAYDSGDSTVALAEYTRLIELDPTDELAYYRRGRIFYDQEEWVFAISDFTKAIDNGYKDNYVYFFRGYAYSENGEYEEAVADYTRSIELDPDCEDDCWIDYNNRGVSYERNGDLQLAIADYTTAIELNQEYALAYSNRGYLNEDFERYDDALFDWNQALILRQERVDEREMITDSYTIESRIDETGHQILVMFEGEAGQPFTAETTRPDFDLDPVLMLRDPDGEPIAFNDDVSDDNRDALIVGLELPEDGTYILVIASANGRGVGDFALTVTLSE